MSDEEDAAPQLPQGVPHIWGMARRDGTPVNIHRFRGGMRHDGALWCVTCERLEHLDGRPFGVQPAGGTIKPTP